MATVVRDAPRASRAAVDAVGAFSVATLHEAQGRTGLLSPSLRPIYRPLHVAGSALTCQVHPGDNWSIHVAAELARPGDVLVVSCSEPCTDGFFGELLATSMRALGVVGLVIDGGVRDVAELTEMQFPVWSSAISAQGTIKERLGDVQTPLVCGGKLVTPGDIIVADDDGVVVVERARAFEIAELARSREEKEASHRARFARGELSIDVMGLRHMLDTN